MGKLSEHAIQRVSTPTWDRLRPQFLEMGRLLLGMSLDVNSEFISHYIKFMISTGPNSPPFAVVWLKNTKRLIIGMALPETYEAEEFGPSLPGTAYKGLTKYFTVEPGTAVPKGFSEWARLAYENVLSAMEVEESSPEEFWTVFDPRRYNAVKKQPRSA